MKLRLLSFSLFVTLLAAGAFFTGCTQTDTPGTTDTRSKVISSSTDTYVDVTGLSDNQLYEFTVAGSSAATVTGFSSYQNNTIRVFWTRGSGDVGADTVYYKTTTSTTAESGFSGVWATADVTGTKANPIILYETSDPSSSHPSGLVLGSTSSAVSITGSQSSNVDLVLVTVAGLKPAVPGISLQAADVTGSNITNGRAGDYATNAHQTLGGLAMNSFLNDISAQFPTITGPNDPNRVNVEDFADNVPTIHDGSSLIFLVKTSDNHYARVEVLPQPAGSNYLWGDTGGSNSKRFISVIVSYQPTAGWGYVSRPGEVRRGTNTARHATSRIVHD